MTGRPLHTSTSARPANGQPPATPPATAAKPNVVFLIDFTGSMSANEKRVKLEVGKAINELPDGQPFNLIATHADRFAVFATKMVPAGPASRKTAQAFLDKSKVLGGSGQLEKSLQAACAFRPDVFWFITDGDFDGPASTPDVTDQLLKIAAPSKVKINTSLVLASHDVTQGYGRVAIEKLAKSTGGTCFNDAGAPATESDISAPTESKPTDQADLPSIFKTKMDEHPRK